MNEEKTMNEEKSMNDAARFGTHCKMTCLGGSEKGTCDCKHPDCCELQDHPKFREYRIKARERMARYLMTLKDEQ
jgi:hypothetical protein